jgi:DNA-binding MarR family transcriptional regulator
MPIGKQTSPTSEAIVSEPSPFDEDDVDQLRRSIGKLSRSLRLKATDGDLTPTQLSLLFTVVRCGPLSMAELADLEGINPTMLSRAVAKLGDAGLVARTPDPDDRRAAQVAATAAGRRLRTRTHRARAAVLREHLAGLDPAQAAALHAALPGLEALADALKGRRA